MRSLGGVIGGLIVGCTHPNPAFVGDSTTVHTSVTSGKASDEGSPQSSSTGVRTTSSDTGDDSILCEFPVMDVYTLQAVRDDEPIMTDCGTPLIVTGPLVFDEDRRGYVASSDCDECDCDAPLDIFIETNFMIPGLEERYNCAHFVAEFEGPDCSLSGVVAFELDGHDVLAPFFVLAQGTKALPTILYAPDEAPSVGFVDPRYCMCSDDSCCDESASYSLEFPDGTIVKPGQYAEGAGVGQWSDIAYRYDNFASYIRGDAQCQLDVRWTATSLAPVEGTGTGTGTTAMGSSSSGVAPESSGMLGTDG